MFFKKKKTYLLACGVSAAARTPVHVWLWSGAAALSLRRFSACGTSGPKLGTEPQSLVLHGSFFTTRPSGKSPAMDFLWIMLWELYLR